MLLINKDTKLFEVVIQEPAVTTVLSRFGIALGVGDKSVKHICDEHVLDCGFFLAILNTFVNPDYFPSSSRLTFDVSEVVSYLSKTNDYYRQVLIPNVEQHFNLLIKRSSAANSNLELMQKFFFEVKDEMLARIEYDSTTLFPYALSFEKRRQTNPVVIVADAERYGSEEDSTAEDKLNDLISMFVMHLSGIYDTNLCQAVLLAIINLKKDVCQNNRIRNKILMPLYRTMVENEK